ncbi:MAG: class I adenylate-forming enzyme family protein, partial [Myxococcota bacterium]|nr:class I adenylate-forming enzyme family protein [Myxococcota bacterium]
MTTPQGGRDAKHQGEIQQQIRAQLTGPGGPFEIVEQEVLGETMPVFKNRQRCLRELVDQSKQHGDAEYLVQEARRISYTDHHALVASVARGLAEQYGIGKGDRVAILAANCPEWLITFWAATSLGAIVAALNGWWTRDEIQYGVELSQCKLLVGDRKRLARVDDVDLGVPICEIERDFETLERFAPDAALPTTPIDEDDPALILFTSGTTGRPKGALVSHRALIGFPQVFACQGAERFMLAAQLGEIPADAPPPAPTASLVTAPLFHLSGLYTAGIMMFSIGAKTVYRAGRFDPEDVLRLIEKERITTWSALGSTGPQVVEHPSI